MIKKRLLKKRPFLQEGSFGRSGLLCKSARKICWGSSGPAENWQCPSSYRCGNLGHVWNLTFGTRRKNASWDKLENQWLMNFGKVCTFLFSVSRFPFAFPFPGLSLPLCFFPRSRVSLFPFYYESQLSSMAKLIIANEVRIGGLGGGRLQTDDFEALPHLIRVATVVDFEADVPGGNWVTVGFDSPLVRPPTCIWGEWNGG